MLLSIDTILPCNLMLCFAVLTFFLTPMRQNKLYFQNDKNIIYGKT